MPLRALRLLHLPTAAEAPTVASARSLSFSSTLQLAAGRAWARRVLVHHDNAAAPTPSATRAVHTTLPRRHESQATAAGPSSLKPVKTLASNLATKAPHSLSSTKASPSESQTATSIGDGTAGKEQKQSSRARKRRLSKSERLQRRNKLEQAAMSEHDGTNFAPILPSEKSSSVEGHSTGDSTKAARDGQPQAPRVFQSSSKNMLPSKIPPREQSTKPDCPPAPKKRPPHGQSKSNGSHSLKDTPLPPPPKYPSPNSQAIGDSAQAKGYEEHQRSPPRKHPSQEGPPNKLPLPDLPEMTEVGDAIRIPPPLPLPNSSQALHRNLLYMLSNKRPVPPLPALIEYHDRYPKCHSTASYNLLMTIAVRHRQHGILQAMLSAQEQAGIPKDIDTYVLIIRSILQRGKWKAGWNYAQQLKDSRVFPKNAANRYEIPFPIWIELCTCPRTPNPIKVYDADGQVSRIISEVVDQKTPDALRKRQRMLASEKPLDIPPLAYTSPYGILALVQLLIRSQDHAGALRLAKEYLGALAQRRATLTSAQNDACLRIVHALVARIEQKAASPKPEARFYAGQRLLFTLLKLHPGLRPTARTVFVMLAPLKRALKCGTIVWKEVRIAKWKWGARVVDMAVLRRCAALAHKERQRWILDRVIEAQEELTRRARRTQRVSGPEYQARRWRRATRSKTPAGQHRPNPNVESVAELRKEEKEKIAWTDRAVFEAILNGVSPVKLPLNHVYTRAGRERALWARLTHRIRFARMKAAAMRQDTTVKTAGSPNTNTTTPIHSQTKHPRSRSSPYSSILGGSREIRGPRK